MGDTMHSSIRLEGALTLDEFESLLGPEFMGDSAYEVDTGLRVEGGMSILYWSASHFGWIDEHLQSKVEEIIEMRSDVRKVEVRTANYDANPDSAVKASIYERHYDGSRHVQHFEQALIPTDTRERIASIPTIRRESGDAAAWLVVGDLLNTILKGMNL